MWGFVSFRSSKKSGNQTGSNGGTLKKEEKKKPHFESVTCKRTISTLLC